MKKFEKIGAAIFGALMVVLFFMILSFKSPEPPPQSSNKITTVGNANVYRLNVDGIPYIVVVGGSGVAITRHR